MLNISFDAPSGRDDLPDSIAGEKVIAGSGAGGEPVHCDRCGFHLKGEDIGIVDPQFTGNEIMFHCRCYSCGYEWVE